MDDLDRHGLGAGLLALIAALMLRGSFPDAATQGVPKVRAMSQMDSLVPRAQQGVPS
jgi:hypothetical protein